jgi:hypothetical protein
MSGRGLAATGLSGSYASGNQAEQFSLWLLAVMIINVTTFDAMSVGSIPLWLLLPIAGAALIAQFPSLTAVSLSMFQRLEWRVVVPWIVYVGIITIFLFTREPFDTRRIILAAMQLAVLMVALTLSYSVAPRYTLYLIAAIAIFQGIVCVGQVLQLSWARAIPDFFFSLGGNSMDDAPNANPYDAIRLQIRARGSLEFVHKFNPMQGMLAAIMVTFAFGGGRRLAQKFHYHRWFIVLGAIFGTLGMVLTFSRSTILGLGVTVMLLSWRARGGKRFFLIATVLIVIAGVVAIFSVGGLPQLGRLLSSDPFDAENASRTKQFLYTWQVLWTSPIFGAPMKILPGEYPMHSVLFKIFTDFGIIGAIPYLCIIFGITTLGWRQSRSVDPAIRVTALAVLGVMSIVLADGWTHSSGLIQTDVAQSVFLGVTLGMMFRAQDDARHTRNGKKPASQVQNVAIGKAAT